MVKHIVMWRLKDEAEGNSKEINAMLIKERLEALKKKISYLRKIEVGINFEKSNAAYDVVLYTEFDNEEDLNNYQVHPDHLEQVAFIRSVVNSRVVADYKI